MENQERPEIDLLEVLGSIAPLSAAYHDRLRSQLVTQQYPARHLLLQPGEICRQIHFISSGMVRIYNIDKMGKEKTIIFMGAGELAVDVSSFYEQSPATEYLETLQPTTIQSLTWHQLNSFYADFKEGNYIGRIITQKYLMLAVERNTELMNSSIADRYISLLLRYPHIEQQVSQHLIASYLGVSRETLSKMKADQLKIRST